MRRLVMVLLFANACAAANAASAAGQTCARGTNAAAARLETLVAAVRVDDLDAVKSDLRRAWSATPDRKDDLDAAIVNASQWAVLSDGLAPDSTCVEGDTAAVGDYRNNSTGGVDRVRVEVADSKDHEITAVTIRPSERLMEVPPELEHDLDRIRVLDQRLTQLIDNGVFSGVVLVAHRGVPIYLKATGTANRALGVPITESTQFNLASLNKLFTAVAIMQLVEKGALRIDDTLAGLLPNEFANGEAAAIQVKHLLSHTSGLSMYGPTFVFSPPGSGFAYSNYGYKVLGDIIESKAKMRYEDYLRLKILGPLEMANTARYDLKEISDYVTLGYYYPIPAIDDRVTLIPNKYLHIYTGGPMGGMYSSAPDILKFANGLVGGRLVTAATLELMKQPKPELGAPEYGYGVTRWRAPGVWGHSGRLPGADADLEFYSNDYVAIVLANLDHVNEPVLLITRALFHE